MLNSIKSSILLISLILNVLVIGSLYVMYNRNKDQVGETEAIKEAYYQLAQEYQKTTKKSKSTTIETRKPDGTVIVEKIKEKEKDSTRAKVTEKATEKSISKTKVYKPSRSLTLIMPPKKDLDRYDPRFYYGTRIFDLPFE